MLLLVVPKKPIDPKAEWKTLELCIESPEPYLLDYERLHQEYYPRVNALLIGRLERFVRAIALQFTIGDHRDPKKYIRQVSMTFSNFRSLEDNDLGKTDYRRSVKVLQNKQHNWVKRSENEIINGGLARIVNRSEFEGDWPFRADRVILECVDSTFLIVNIYGYAYSLNGAANSSFNISSAHDAGVAILGKSVGPFIEMAWELAPQESRNL